MTDRPTPKRLFRDRAFSVAASRAAILLALPCAGAPARAQTTPPAGVPVAIRRVEIGPKHYLIPAGVGFDRVRGLKRGGDGFLSVRSGPGEAFAETDRLREGRFVFVAEERAGWKGVIYPRQPLADSDAAAALCGLDEKAAATLERPRAYSGPCASGWAAGRWIERLAD